MATQPAAGTRVMRGVVGYLVGTVAGGLTGWLIDRAITDDPYAGVRIGIFLGGLFGALIGSGAGWRGIVVMLSMVVCSAAGAVAALVVWKPDPGRFVGMLPTALGGMAGAVLGLALGAVLLRSRLKAPAPPA